MIDEQLKTRIEFLQQLRIFKKASESELTALAKALQDVVIHEGEEIVTKGDKANNLYIIARGKVKIHDGQHVFQEVGKGHVFGEYSLFHTHTRTASVSTLETTYLLRLNQDDFKHLLESNPNIQLSVIQSLVDTIAIQNELEKELAEKNIQIEIQKVELEKAIKTKDRFFSLLAHDLRSPLASLGSYLNLLIGSDLLSKEEIITYANDIQKSVNGVVEMLDNLLNWAISETGEWQMQAKDFAISNSIKRVVDLYRDHAENKDISIRSSTCDAEVHADSNAVDVILRNLLANAIKYSPSESMINIDCIKTDSHVEVSIKDNGPGMDEKTQANLFNIDIKNQSSRRSKGTGLGLILAKEFAEKNGGSLRFNSSEGQGSEFIFQLPLSK